MTHQEWSHTLGLFVQTKKKEKYVQKMCVKDLGKSSLTTGLQVSYLLNAKGTYQETVSDAFSTVNREAITQNGYQTVFNRLDFGLSLGYEYQITKSLSFGGQAQIGFLDVTDNNIFKNTVTDRNAMLKVYATYDFWKIK